MKHRNTKLSLGKGHYEVDSVPTQLAGLSGLLPMRVVIDLTVGEEVALYWLDPTPFVRELAAILPFQLFMRSGLFRSQYGPLMWMLFYVPNPGTGGQQPFASTECYLNLADIDQVSLWRDLSAQTHWHLTLLGANNKVHNFFEFENVYDLASVLDVMQAAIYGLPVTDFMCAKQEFYDTYTIDDLFKMA